MRNEQQRFNFDADPLELRDLEARRLAVDPERNVALEASAGTGKTRVLVDRYVALLASGVKPRNILAITFTRKAAAEMRQRILHEIARRGREQTLPRELLDEIREHLSDISISTIDAFCVSLLREFPLEADVDPAFELADETETPRLMDEALDRTMRAARGIAANEPEMALLFAELGEYQLRQGLARLLDRRLVAADALHAFVRGAEHATIDLAVGNLLRRLRDAFATIPGGAEGLIACGPSHPDFGLFVGDVRALLSEPPPAPPVMQALLERVRDHVLTQQGEPRKRLNVYRKTDFRSPADYDRHVRMVQALGPYLVQAFDEFRRDLNLVLARAVRQLFAIATREYARTLRKHGVLDFSDVLERTLSLLSQMEEFSRSRYKLEARYQHVLVDEFQDTSRAQWTLIGLLVRSWAAGLGITDRPPTIFIVGDRKQSIYGFRDAEVAVLDEAAQFIEALRPTGRVRTAITRSFRSVRPLLHFVNDVFSAIEKAPDRPDAFRYGDDDRFPLGSGESVGDSLGIVAAPTDAEQAAIVAEEIATLLNDGVTVRDRDTGIRRPARPGDIALLFRTREGHRLFEDALTSRGVPYYVYKGLGFFDSDEIKDVLALLAFLARPHAAIHAAAFLRSRFVRLSDEALKVLAPDLVGALLSASPPPDTHQLHPEDSARLGLARSAVPRWVSLVDRIPPSELLDEALAGCAYAAETAGPAYRQARENLKKIRGLVRRMQNRGYATLARIVDHLQHLVTGGDESNAIVDALDAVNLMTTHAAKGLEFPIVFVVNMHRGSGGAPDPIRVWPAALVGGESGPEVAIGAHESAADRDLEARESEEAKRLLYVALTRARDRLYLAATVEGGGFNPGKGGLGRTLPVSFAQLFQAASPNSGGIVTWSGPTGAHALRALTRSESLTRVRLAGPGQEATTTVDDFYPFEPDGPVRVTVGTLSRAERSPVPIADSVGSSVELGRLVHRALQMNVTDPRLVMTDSERASDDGLHVAEQARAALAAVRADPRVDRLLAADDIEWRGHEVSFTLRRADGVFVRGAIDCVAVRRDGTVEVFEFKTGRGDAAHHVQLETYVEAAQALFPGRVVTGHLVYAAT